MICVDGEAHTKEPVSFEASKYWLNPNSILEAFLADGLEYSPSLGEVVVLSSLELIVECRRLATLLGKAFNIQTLGSKGCLNRDH